MNKGGIGSGLYAVALVLSALAAGCNMGTTEVQVQTRTTDGVYSVANWGISGGFNLNWWRAHEAIQAKAPTYIVELYAPGVLNLVLSVDANGKDSAAQSVLVHYLYEGGQASLAFQYQPGVLFANGKAATLDLSEAGGGSWFLMAEPRELASVRTVRLSGDVERDLMAIKVLGRPAMLWDLSAYGERVPATQPASAPASASTAPRVVAPLDSLLIRAISGTHPAGLILPRVGGARSLARECTGLRHLYASLTPDDIAPLVPDLVTLGLYVAPPADGNSVDIKALTAAQNLKTLSILSDGTSDGTIWLDYHPLTQIKGLKTLEIGSNPGLINLEPLAEMQSLRMLLLAGLVNVRDVSAAGRLRSLRSLVLLGMQHDITGIRELRQLKDLRLLLVDKDHLKQQQADFDYLRQELPEARIEGFCLGSWVVVPIIAVGAAGGALWRNRRNRQLLPTA